MLVCASKLAFFAIISGRLSMALLRSLPLEEWVGASVGKDAALRGLDRISASRWDT